MTRLCAPPFQYHMPTAIEFGAGVLARIATVSERLGSTRALVVGDAELAREGLVDRVSIFLVENGLAVTPFTDIDGDPDIAAVDEGAALARAERCDLVVGIGGGGALDLAKAIGLMAANEGTLRDHAGFDRAPKPGLPVIAIPTTAGAGSEVTAWAVLPDKAAKASVAVGGPFVSPRAALCDPELTLSLSPAATAASGMEALANALEAYVGRTSQPLSEALAVQAMTLIAHSLRVAVAQGDNLSARSDMMLAGTLAGMACGNVRPGLVHALAQPLSLRFGIPQGVAEAILLPAVIRFNLPACLDKYVQVARIFGEPVAGLSPRRAAERAAVAIDELRRDIGIAAKLGAFGVAEKHVDEIVEDAVKAGTAAGGPHRAAAADMAAILRAELA